LRIIFIKLGSRTILSIDGVESSGHVIGQREEEGGALVKKLVLLATAALVAMLILVPSAMAQEMEAEVKKEMTVEKDLPKSGGVGLAPLALPAAALLLGSGVVVYAFVRRR
jgi:hypothetical protein